MVEHPHVDEDDIIEQTIHRELARQKLPSARPQASFEQEDPPSGSPEGDHEVPTTAIRWSTYLLPFFTVLLGAAFCILLVIYLTQLYQDNARYTQLGETLTAIQALSEENDDLQTQVDRLEKQANNLLESTSGLDKRLEESTKEAQIISMLYQSDHFFSEGDYTYAAITLDCNVTDVEEYLEEYDRYNQEHYYVTFALLPHYEFILNTLVAEGYLFLETEADGTQYAYWSQAVEDAATAVANEFFESHGSIDDEIIVGG